MFNIDIIADEEARTPFEFEMDGKVWRVPHVVDLTIGQQIDLDSGRVHKVLRDVAEIQDGDDWKPAGGEAARLILGMKSARVGKVLAAWLAHAGMEPGESGASPS